MNSVLVLESYSRIKILQYRPLPGHGYYLFLETGSVETREYAALNIIKSVDYKILAPPFCFGSPCRDIFHG